MNIDINGATPFYHVPECPNRNVEDLALRCIAAQRDAVSVNHRPPGSLDAAKAAVAPEALERILSDGDDIHGIAEDEGLSDVIVFNATHLDGSVRHGDVARLRQDLDREVTSMLRHLLGYGRNLEARRSGHFWYPPGSHMAWHTNNKAPGWRVYLTHSQEPGRSFFRYRDPLSGEIFTSMDNRWDLRLFRVDPAQPLWHAVYSETDRFSFGYAIVIKPFIRAALSRARSTLADVLRPSSRAAR
jgi:hypothetical protein